MFEKRGQRLRERELREEKEKNQKLQYDTHEIEVEEGSCDDQMDVDDTGPSHVEQEPIFNPVSTTSGCVRAFPRHFKGFLPSSATSVPHMPDRPPKIVNKNIPKVISEPYPSPEPPQVAEVLSEMEPNEFGLWFKHPGSERIFVRGYMVRQTTIPPKLVNSSTAASSTFMHAPTNADNSRGK